MKRLVCLMSFLFPAILFAQRNFQPGYIVTQKGDTLTGYIDYKEWDNSPPEVIFKPGLNTDFKKYTASDVSYFEIIKKEAYQSAMLKISLDPIALTDLSGRDTSSKTEQVFAKVLFRGDVVSLLSFTDKLKTRFYISEATSAGPVELIYREFFRSDDRTTVISEDSYRTQLRTIAYNHNTATAPVMAAIDDVKYEGKGLKNVVYLLNNIDKKNIAKINGNSPSGMRFFVGAGLATGKLSYSGDQFFARNGYSSQSTVTPAVAGGIDFFFNPNVGRVLFRLEAGYRSTSATSTGSSGNNTRSVYDFSMSAISFHPQVIFNVFNLPTIKVPVGFGFGYNVLSYKKNILKEYYISQGIDGPVKDNYFDLNKGAANFLVRTGITLFNKIDASFIYYTSFPVTGNLSYAVSNQNMQFQIAYFFSQGKK